MHSVREKMVAKLLGVNLVALQRLHIAKVLVRDYTDGYSLERLNAFLAASAQNFVVPPRWEDLIRRRETFMSDVAAREKFRCTNKQLSDLRTRYNVPHLVVQVEANRGFLYLQSSLRSSMWAIRSASMLPSVEAVMPPMWLAGYTEPADFASAFNDQHVEPTMLMAHLLDAVKDGVDVSQWVAECAAARRPPVGVDMVATQLGVPPHAAFNQLLEREVPFVRQAPVHGYAFRFTPLWWLTWEEKYSISALPDMARLFGGAYANGWRKRCGPCPLSHGHERKPQWYNVCWLAYLTRQVPFRFVSRVSDFWEARLIRGDDSPLLGIQEAANMVGMKSKDLVRAAVAGEVLGIRTPGGQWRFAPEWLS